MKKYDQAYDLFIIFIKWLSHYELNFPMNTDSNIETKSVSVRANGPKSSWKFGQLVIGVDSSQKIQIYVL